MPELIMTEGNAGEEEFRMEKEIQVWLSRRFLYGMFAVTLANPLEEKWPRELFTPSFLCLMESLQLSETLRGELETLEDVVQDPFRFPQLLAEARSEYQRLFAVPLKGSMVSLGAAAYLPQEIDLYRRRAAFEGWYERFGFNWREYLSGTCGVWPNEPEHAVLILALLAILADEIVTSLEERDGLDRDLEQVGQEILDMAREWLPQCLSAIENQSRSLFYRTFAQLSREILVQDDWRRL